MTSSWRKGAALLAALALGAALAPSADAQEPVRIAPDPQFLSAGGSPDTPDLDLTRRPSLFNIGALGDEAAVGIRTNGQVIYCVQNVPMFTNRFNFGCRYGSYTRRQDGDYASDYFDMGLVLTAPASDLPSTIDPAVVKGGGYTVNMTTLIIGGAVKGGGDKLWASDRTSRELLALGVKSTDDAECTNFSAERDGNMFDGFQLLPASDCPATVPAGPDPTDPFSGWRGGHPIPEESFLELQANDPAFQNDGTPVVFGGADPFAFWRVPEDLQRTDRLLGNFSTYGETMDWYLQALGRYGGVTPMGAGAPSYEGWPLGITVFFDAFYFNLPTVGGSLYYQATLVNESEQVYGVGMTYDSLYIGVNHDPLQNSDAGSQASAQYMDPSRSALLHNTTGNKCANNPDPPGSGCRENGGFAGGSPGMAIIVLKSPIGDVRYKLFSDPTSPFFNPGHPLAGDTIAFQHQRQCGFGDCIPRTWTRSQRANFGFWSSTGINVLDGETPGDLSDRQYHRIFRPEAWPERTGEFNKYVPGVGDSNPVWDWNHDGVPDTIYADSCGSRGCVELWSDTLPSGYTNNYGNIAGITVGPVHIGPGDTIPFIVALVGASDSAGIESSVNNTIDFYNRFFLGPEAAPAPAITAVDVVPGQARDNEITLFFDDATEEWQDPFLATLDVSADVALNPWLADSVTALISNNVAAIHIFKSCDGGTSYTDDDDCDADPVNDPTSKWAAFGWRPYASFDASPEGGLPNTFTDEDIIPGVTYTYSIVTETRGAAFNLVRTGAGGFEATEVEFAPSLFSGLSASGTNPFVAIAYAPLNLAAGARRALLVEVESAKKGFSTVPVEANVIGTSPVSGAYRAAFADSIRVIVTENLVEGQVSSTQTTVRGLVVRTVTDENDETVPAVIQTLGFDRSGTISMSGLTEVEVVETGNQRKTSYEGGFGMILVTQDSQRKPLLASTTLSGSEATPGTFLGTEDFPFFVIEVDASVGGTFADEIFTLGADTIDEQVAPSVVWRRGTGLSSYLAGDYGTYVLTWTDDAFGQSPPFRIDQRASVEASFQSSVAARSESSSSSTSADDLDAIKAADATVTLDATDLRAYELPFTVRNTVYDRDVSVVVTTHQDSVLLGQGADSLRVEVPAGKWMPGDVLYFVETLTQEVTDENGNTVLGAGGQPETETLRVATFKTVLGCLAPRNSCDPTVGGSLSSGYVVTPVGTAQEVQYYVPLKGGDWRVYRVEAAIAATDAASGDVNLNRVHVVPNPYIFATAFERETTDRVIKWTNLPPEGRIRIFDLSGRFIQELNYEAADLNGGDLDWNLRTREDLELAAGLYVWVLETDNDKKMGKFVVIR